MSIDQEPESCLANLAGLVVLNEFDNIVGNIFDLRVKYYFPKLAMVDDLLKDSFKIESQRIAEVFTAIFLILNFIIIIPNSNC